MKKTISIFVGFFWAVPILLLARLSYPIWRFNFTELRSDRIGHFIPDSIEYIFCDQKRTTNFFLMNRTICNKYWADKIARDLIIISANLSPLCDWNRILPGTKMNTLSVKNAYGISKKIDKSHRIFQFSNDENTKGINFLKSLGWSMGEPFICFLNRDSVYLNTVKPEIDWDYHDYRNSNIITYDSALKWIANKGVWVLRMGKLQGQVLNFQNSKVVDYAFDTKKSDFLDVWLFANATGCISNSSGPDWISVIYNVPQLFINYLPMAHLVTRSACIVYPKKLLWKSSGSPLTLAEQLQHQYFEGDFYTLNDILVVDLNREEILVAFQEFYGWIINRVNPFDDLSTERRTFFEILTAWKGFSRLISHNEPKGLPAKSWLDAQTMDFFR